MNKDEQAVQAEPVAWGVRMLDKWWVGLWAWKETAEVVAAKHSGDKVIPLYAAAQAERVEPAVRFMKMCSRHEGMAFTCTTTAVSGGSYCPICEQEKG